MKQLILLSAVVVAVCPLAKAGVIGTRRIQYTHVSIFPVVQDDDGDNSRDSGMGDIANSALASDVEFGVSGNANLTVDIDLDGDLGELLALRGDGAGSLSNASERFPSIVESVIRLSFEVVESPVLFEFTYGASADGATVEPMLTQGADPIELNGSNVSILLPVDNYVFDFRGIIDVDQPGGESYSFSFEGTFTTPGLMWIDPQGGAFSDAENWEAGQAPTMDDAIVFDLVNGGYVVTMDVNPTVASLRVPQGTVSLDFLGGAGELLDVDGDVIVGETAGVRGGLDVIGGRLEAKDILVGGSTGADALVTLREGATLDWTGELRLGGAEGASSAQLFAISGAQANVNSVATVGRGGEWTATSLSVGEDRPGAFNVLAGGRVELSQFLDVAEDGEMLVQGDGDPSSAQVVVNGNLVVQDGGGLRVASGGRVNVGSLEAASEVYLNSVSGEGEPAAALIEGDESFLFAIGDLHVGYAIVGEEHGELEIRDGADVIAFGSLLAGQEGGNDSGRILVDGPNSNLLVEAARIGNGSSRESRLDVRNGATVDINVGDLLVDSSGRVSVDGVNGEHRSQLKTKASVVAARGAEIVVSQGALLAAGDIDSTEDTQDLVVGASADGPANPARLLVQDANSRAIAFGSLRVGDALNAPGVVEVTGGGEVIALGDLHLGRNGVATKGELTASGDGSVVLAGEGFVGFDGATTPDLTSRLSASDGAVVTLVERLVVLDNGTVDVSGGGSVYIGGEGGAPVAGKVVIGPDGELWGTGTIVGDRDNQGGVDNYGMAYPGQSPGVLTIDGDYYQAPSGGLVIEVAGKEPGGQHDVLSVAGDAVIEGKVAFEFLNGFAPRQGDVFEFLDVDGTLDLASAAFTITNLAKGFEYNLAASGSGYQLTALNDAQFRFAADFVFDGQVDLLDFNTLKANFGALDATQDDGDANDDGVVDLIDFNLLKGQFGASVAVPEPNSLTISATGMLVLFALRRRQLG